MHNTVKHTYQCWFVHQHAYHDKSSAGRSTRAYYQPKMRDPAWIFLNFAIAGLGINWVVPRGGTLALSGCSKQNRSSRSCSITHSANCGLGGHHTTQLTYCTVRDTDTTPVSRPDSRSEAARERRQCTTVPSEAPVCSIRSQSIQPRGLHAQSGRRCESMPFHFSLLHDTWAVGCPASHTSLGKHRKTSESRSLFHQLRLVQFLVFSTGKLFAPNAHCTSLNLVLLILLHLSLRKKVASLYMLREMSRALSRDPDKE